MKDVYKNINDIPVVYFVVDNKYIIFVVTPQDKTNVSDMNHVVEEMAAIKEREEKKADADLAGIYHFSL